MNAPTKIPDMAADHSPEVEAEARELVTQFGERVEELADLMAAHILAESGGRRAVRRRTQPPPDVPAEHVRFCTGAPPTVRHGRRRSCVACQVRQPRSSIDPVNRVRRKLSRLGLAGSGDGAAASAARSAAKRFGAIVVRFVQ